MNLTGEQVLVVGSGISGMGAVELLLKVQALPILFDANDRLKEKDIQAKFPGDEKLQIILGKIPAAVIAKLALVVLSPGVPTDSSLVEEFRKNGIPIWGEIELAYEFSKGKVLAITGTNGKTTTTALVGKIMKDYYESSYIVGNIGNPYTQIALETKENTVTVAEISSFQLETIQKFHPVVSAILNITPDHMNRHHTMDNYVAVKEYIAKNQTKEDICVLNYEDFYTRKFGEVTTATPFYFSSSRVLKEGIYLEGENIYLAKGGKTTQVMNIYEMKLLGTHNVENVMAAIAVSISYGVSLEAVVATVKTFEAVEHRIEFVATKSGVDYYNDSKGTNPDAAIKGIQAMKKPTILIGGGYDKQSEYGEWIDSFDEKVKYLVLVGQTKEKIAACARAHGFNNVIIAETFEEVMQICVEKSMPGDAVLLSPACASWGMFPNYEVRGRTFKDIVNGLRE